MPMLADAGNLMTRSPTRNRLAALALVLQVLAVFGTMRGLVVCVGAAGHRAIEDREAAARCRADEADLLVDSAGGAPEVRVPAPCVDTPLMTAASDRGASPLRFAPDAIAISAVAVLPRPEVLERRVRPWAEPPVARARLLRSVVLQI